VFVLASIRWKGRPRDREACPSCFPENWEANGDLKQSAGNLTEG
jgi:hypothetical protein